MYMNFFCLFGQGVILKKLTRRRGGGGQQKRTRGKVVKVAQNGLTSIANGSFSKVHWEQI